MYAFNVHVEPSHCAQLESITNYQFTCDGDAMRRPMHAKKKESNLTAMYPLRIAKAHRMGEHVIHCVRLDTCFGLQSRWSSDCNSPSASSSPVEHAVSAMRFPTAKYVTAEPKRLVLLRCVVMATRDAFRIPFTASRIENWKWNKAQRSA